MLNDFLQILIIPVQSERLLKEYLVVTSDHNDTDSGKTAVLNGINNFFTWGVQHTNNTNKGHVCLQNYINKLSFLMSQNNK